MNTEKLELTQIRSNKQARWSWKINLHCHFCETPENIEKKSIFEMTPVAMIFAEINGKLTVVGICEKCFTIWKEAKD